MPLYAQALGCVYLAAIADMRFAYLLDALLQKGRIGSARLVMVTGNAERQSWQAPGSTCLSPAASGRQEGAPIPSLLSETQHLAIAKKVQPETQTTSLSLGPYE